jgi:hypothetical protein
MSKAVLFLVAAIVAVVAFSVAVAVTTNENLQKDIDNDGVQMEFVGNIEKDMFNMYIGQKGSSEKILIDDGGTFDVPSSDPIIILVVKNPASPISIDGNKIIIPMSEETWKVNIGFQYADVGTPVLIDSNSAYYSFTPNAQKINLGVFMTNDDIDDTDGVQMEFVGNIEKYMFNMYIGQKGSSERTLIDDGGTFDVPSSDPVIIIVVKNPASPISIDGNKIIIPMSEETWKANIGFQYADVGTPVLIDSNSAYYPFTPNAEKINLGIFVTN